MFAGPISMQFIGPCEHGMNLASSCLNVDTPSEEAAEEGGGALERESLAEWPAVGSERSPGWNTSKMTSRASRCRTQGRAY